MSLENKDSFTSLLIIIPLTYFSYLVALAITFSKILNGSGLVGTPALFLILVEMPHMFPY